MLYKPQVHHFKTRETDNNDVHIYGKKMTKTKQKVVTSISYLRVSQFKSP